MIGDLPRRLQVALDGGVLHGLYVAEVGEAFAADRVARRVDADLHVDAGEVADRVGVLGARQPADGHPPRLAAVRGLVGVERSADPGRCGGTLRVAREAIGVLRRHLTRLEHPGDADPRLRSLRDGRVRHPLDQPGNIEAGLRPRAAVTLDAVGREGVVSRGSHGRRSGSAPGGRTLGRLRLDHGGERPDR